MLSEKRYNLLFYPILAIISVYIFLSFFFLTISAINQYYNDIPFWTLNSETGLFLFLIFSFIHIEMKKKFKNHSISKLSKIESKKKDKYDFFVEIGTYISALAVFALIYVAILIPQEKNVLAFTLIGILSIVLIICIFLIVYGFSKTKVEKPRYTFFYIFKNLHYFDTTLL